MPGIRGTIIITAKGQAHDPEVPHHVVAWGAIKELLRLKGGRVTEDEVLAVLRFCGHHNPKHNPNTDYLEYALKMGWLARTPT